MLLEAVASSSLVKYEAAEEPLGNVWEVLSETEKPDRRLHLNASLRIMFERCRQDSSISLCVGKCHV